MEGLRQEGRVRGLILHCHDRRCGRRVWRELEDFGNQVTLRYLRAKAICDFCGSLGGFGVGVELIAPVFGNPRPTQAVIDEKEAWLIDMRDFIRSHPFEWQPRNGLWGYNFPDTELLDSAHVRLGLPMCNLYSNTMPQDAMRNVFRAKDRLGNQPSLPAIFPDMEVPIVRLNEDGERELVHARWGWSKAKFGWVTNARNVKQWPWQPAFDDVTQRCLVPASSFSEYHPTETLPPSAPGRKPRKAAAWFALDGDAERPPFAFAGLWRHWNWDKDGLRRKDDEVLSQQNTPTLAMAFLTTEPNAVVAPIHPKAMPVILTEESYETWLTADADAAIALQKPFPHERLKLVNVGEKKDEPTA